MDFPGDTLIPYVDTAQMIEVDRAMVEDYKIELIQMMENAGRNLAHLARQRFFAGDPIGKRVAIMAGSGGNGGGALVAARHLHNWGANVCVYLARPAESMAPIPQHQLVILQRMKINGANFVTHKTDLDASFDLILDGLIGYSLSGAPRGIIVELIRWANRQTTPILSLDIASGIDTTTGTVYEPAIMATATMTLALPKTVFQLPAVRAHTGELYLADISVPPELYSKPSLGFRVAPLFAREEVVRLL